MNNIKKKGLIALILIVGVFCALLTLSSTSYAATSSYSVSKITKPTSLNVGQSFSISGIVSSKTKLVYVRAGVQNSSGSWISGSNATAKPYSKSYNIINLDSKIKFGSLKAGTYYYRILVKDTNGISKRIISQKFEVKSLTKYTLSNITKPTSLNIGQSFNVKGMITGTNKISYVRAGVQNVSGSWISGSNATAKPYLKKYDLINLDSKIKFGSLKAGTYYYKVLVKDSSGSSKLLVSQKFQVKNPTTYSLSNISSPTSLKMGQSFGVYGKISSNKKITYVRAGVINRDGYWVSGSNAKAYPASTAYNLNNMDNSIKFGSLKIGTYYYKVYCNDSNGIQKCVYSKKFSVVVAQNQTEIVNSPYSGQDIVDYACQFVGNPYIYGGTSLTNGADCSGFVLSVFKKFGISLPHGSDYMKTYGTLISTTSTANAKPGDIIIYTGHVSIYIGNGKEVHAINTQYGIAITNVGFSRGQLLMVRRLIK